MRAAVLALTALGAALCACRSPEIIHPPPALVADVPPRAWPPLAALEVDADLATLATALDRESKCDTYDRVGGSGYYGSGACHTQGVTATSRGVVTSCQDGDAEMGLLVHYEGALEDFAGGDEPVWELASSLDDGARSHVVVGSGLAPAGDRDLFPVVSSNDRGVPAEVTLRGRDHIACRFVHDPGAGDRHLGASALTRVDGDLYLATCSWDCDRFFVYRIGELEDSCSAELVAEVAIADDESRRVDAGAGDDRWGPYNSLALVIARDGAVVLVAGHHGWLDTWQLTGFPGPELGLRKLAKAEWGRNQADHGRRGMFYEGMSLAATSASTLELLAAPHDLGLDDCGAGRSCMRALYRCDLDL